MALSTDCHQATLVADAGDADQINEDDTGKSPFTTLSSELTMVECTDKHVVRKIDRRLLPLFALMYMLQYLDKSSLSYAAVFDFRKDRGLTDRQYSLLGTIFYVGYSVGQLPGLYLLQKTRTNLLMGVMMLAWGGVLIATVGAKTFSGLMFVRGLLGLLESLVTPGFGLITARFYTRQEQPLRFNLWYCFNGVGNMVGGLLGYGTGHIRVNSVRPWAWIFIVNGTATILGGVLFLILSPDSPETAHFLSTKEREVALQRVATNQSSLHTNKFKLYQFVEAVNPLADIQAWLLTLSVFALTICNGGLGTYLHIILTAYGFTGFQATLLAIPGGFLQLCSVASIGYASRRLEQARIYLSLSCISIAFVGIVLLYTTSTTAGRLVGYYMMFAYIPALGQIFSLPLANVTGYTKRITVQIMLFLAYGLGNSIGPIFWKEKQTPPYRDGLLSCMVCFASALLLLASLRLYYTLETLSLADAFSDKTDTENDRNFRYCL